MFKFKLGKLLNDDKAGYIVKNAIEREILMWRSDKITVEVSNYPYGTSTKTKYREYTQDELNRNTHLFEILSGVGIIPAVASIVYLTDYEKKILFEKLEEPFKLDVEHPLATEFHKKEVYVRMNILKSYCINRKTQTEEIPSIPVSFQNVFSEFIAKHYFEEEGKNAI